MYNLIATRRDARRFPPPGRLVSVQGVRLHLDCRGEGSPTVVFESGGGDIALTWTLVQPEVAHFTRACSYDRAGLGYSDEPRSDEPRSGRYIAGELHALLTAAGVAGPYVLVGHSYGGFWVRLFTAAFPAAVAGVVLVDASHEDHDTLVKARLSPAAQRFGEIRRRQLLRAVWVNRFGILRLRPAIAGLDPSAPVYRRLPTATMQAFTFLNLQTKKFRTTVATIDASDETLAQVRAAGTLGGRPLVVLAAGIRDVVRGLSRADADGLRHISLDEEQPALARLSTRGHLVVVDNSGHMIPFERPDTVVEAVRTVVDEVRREGRGVQ